MQAQNSSPKSQQVTFEENPEEARIANLDSQLRVQENLDQRWAEIKTDAFHIPPRSYHTMSFYYDRIIIYGGYNDESGIQQDFYQLRVKDASNYSWESVPISSTNQVLPGKLFKHNAAIHKDKLYVFGGQKDSVYNCNSFYSFDFIENQWEEIQSENLPPQIDSHGMQVIEDSIFVLCGYIGGETSSYSNGVYKYDINSKQWSEVFKNDSQDKALPGLRAGFASAVIGNDIYIHGGFNNERKFFDLWKFDTQQAKWIKLEAKSELQPVKRNGHSMISYDGKLYIFGGIQDITKEKNDIFEFNIESQTWSQIYKEKPISSPKKSKQSQSQSSTLQTFDKQVTHKSSGRTPYNRNKSVNSPSKRTTSPKNKEPSFQQFTYTTEEELASMTYVEQKKLQANAQEKMLLLKELEQQYEDLGVDQSNLAVSPTSLAMKKSIFQIEQSQQNGSPQKEKSKQINDSTVFEENLQSTLHNFSPSKQFIQGQNILIGKRPFGRDGATACLIPGDSKLVIFGGDRHLMSYNDIYFFDLINQFN